MDQGVSPITYASPWIALTCSLLSDSDLKTSVIQVVCDVEIYENVNRNPHGPNEPDLFMRVVKFTGETVPKSDFDLLLTDPDCFVKYSDSILGSNFLCCFIIQDIEDVSMYPGFCEIMNKFVQYATQSYRARVSENAFIICFSKDRVRLNPPFTKFRELTGV
ncbi:hypothetical protein FBUS_09533 [Fasciolopsis buskii]|uniref:Uncharacterized protein n=1 Tax=Fasciolopsis buskii TaxID=27845 RepID=A0A8E0S2N4_9TREM|nr:hypothetical protein FBUS_09533 [Fasciolopsis buski]